MKCWRTLSQVVNGCKAPVMAKAAFPPLDAAPPPLCGSPTMTAPMSIAAATALGMATRAGERRARRIPDFVVCGVLDNLTPDGLGCFSCS